MASIAATIFHRNADIDRAIRQVERLFATSIVSEDSISSPLFEAALVQIVLLLHDLLAKAESAGARVTQTDHLPAIEGVNDLTDLIRECRLAACRLSSRLPYAPDENAIIFCVAAGRSPPGLVVGGLALHCDFDDDIAVYWGELRLYVNRNARAALGLAKVALGR